MFKSIEYRLITCLLILMASLMAAVLLFTRGDIAYGVVCAVIVVFSLSGLFRNYRKFNKNILFLLNAMENGDYSFHFSTNRMSLREKELNRMLNRIKEILIKARREIIEDEEFLGTIVESVSTGIIITDEDGFVRNVNRSATELLGLSSLSHLNQLRNVDESFPALFLTMKPGETPLVKIANEREERELSLHLTKIVISGTPLRIITLNNIGSELEAKEMESWIRLIRVLTHEIMNSIAPIISLSETLSERAVQNGMNERDYNIMLQGMQTIHRRSKGLLNFVENYRKLSRLSAPILAPVNIGDLLSDMKKLFPNKNIQYIYKVENPETTLMLDRSQIEQVLINLLKNAGEACVEQIYPEVIISTHCDLEKHLFFLSVCDNGSGILPEVLDKIFVPFFTTKPTGSGIGLSLCKQIMNLHGGSISASSEIGKGSCFTLKFLCCG